jgi:hypothetical protein
MPIDPTLPLSVEERRTFGADCLRDSLTGLPLEQGVGALSVRAQRYGPHLDYILATEGKEARAKMFSRLQEVDRFDAAQKAAAAEQLKLEATGVTPAVAEKAQRP